jgi:type IV secretory pathway VirJ component
LLLLWLALTVPGHAQTDAPANPPQSGPPRSAARAEINDSDALPMLEFQARAPTDLLAILVSGASGWSDLDEELATALQRSGVHVVGWDCRRYFRRPKTSRQTAEDLAAVIQIHMFRWGVRSVALVGDGFGANLLPMVFERMNGEMPGLLVQMSLFGFTGKPLFEIPEDGGEAAAAEARAAPAGAEIAVLPGEKLQCFYGAAEGDSACPSLPKGAESLPLPDDHGELARQILAGLQKRAAP